MRDFPIYQKLTLNETRMDQWFAVDQNLYNMEKVISNKLHTNAICITAGLMATGIAIMLLKLFGRKKRNTMKVYEEHEQSQDLMIKHRKQATN